MEIGFAFDPIFLEHGEPWHPENRGRLEAIMATLKEQDVLSRLRHIPVRPATDDEIAWVHDPDYVDEIREISRAGGGHLDADTIATASTWDAALKAAGAAISATREVLAGRLAVAFCAVRPPGHHALPYRAMGFCFFNNVALAAEAALREGASRVAIVDWDVHHGNGTQEIFYHRGDVLYISVHQAYHEGAVGIFYPGTGTVDEVGVDAGFGKTVNIPLPGGAVDQDYFDAFAQVVLPALRRYRPDIILISAGYDAHHSDPLAGMLLSVRAFHTMTRMVADVAREICGGRLVAVLEGGYDREALASGVHDTLRALMGQGSAYKDDRPPQPHPRHHALVREYLEHAIGMHRHRLGI
ncbi:MAG: histone deacetylase [Armatimonadetes bacterium]|nr:histone deacetylase [Armatimonadota bacterium]